MAEKLDSLYRRLDHLERQKVIASDPGILFTIDEQIRECRQEMEEFESGGRRSQGIARSEFSYYLKWLQEFLRVRNGQPVQVPEMEGQEVMALPYVDMEAEMRPEDEVGGRDFPRNRGGMLNFPGLQPALAEVSDSGAAADHLSTSSDVVGIRTRSVRSVYRFLQRHPDPVVLLGEPGSGKSTTLRELGIELAQEALRRTDVPVPVYVELGKFREPLQADPQKAILKCLAEALPVSAKGLREELERGVEQRAWVILFDAMDEMPRMGDYTERMAALARFADEHAVNVRTVFACRTNDFDASFGHRQLVLRPFDGRRIKEFIRRALGRRFVVEGIAHSPRSAARRLARTEELGSEVGNPLTLSMAVEYMLLNQAWPQGQAMLFQHHLVALATKALLRRSRVAPVEEEIKATVDGWAALAYEIFRHQGAVFIERKALQQVVVGGYVGLALEGGLLLEDKVGGQLKFQHHRLQEYLVGRRLCLPDPPCPDWARVLISPRWQESLLHYFKIGGRDHAAINVIEEQLLPALEYLERLAPLVERCGRIAAKHKARYEGIHPDVPTSTGHDVVMTYSEAQMDRKHTAQTTWNWWQRRERRWANGPVDREMRWSEQIVFAARVARAVMRSACEPGDLVPLLEKLLAHIMKLGRPTAQVRLLAAWREIGPWCSPRVLDAPRRSALDWVRAQTIHVTVSMSASARQVDNAFAVELAWETLNLRLAQQFQVFWENSNLKFWRRARVLLACVCYAMLWASVLVPVVWVGGRVSTAAASEWPVVAQWGMAWRHVAWLGLVGFGAVLTLPVLQQAWLQRVLVAGALLGGAAYMGTGGAEFHSIPGTWGGAFSILTLGAGVLGPGLIMIGSYLAVAWASWVALRATSGKSHQHEQVRRFRDTASFQGVAMLGNRAMVAVGIAAFGTLLFTPPGLVLFLGLVACLMAVAAYFLVKEAAKNAVGYMRKGTVIQDVREEWPTALTVVLLFLLVFGVAKGVEYLASLFLLPGAVGRMLALILLVIVVLLACAYSWAAVRKAWRELRYLMFGKGQSARFYEGGMAEWEAKFRNASDIDRREMLSGFDHRVMKVDAEEVLKAFERLEDCVDKKEDAANPFYMVMARLQQVLNQQRSMGGEKE